MRALLLHNPTAGTGNHGKADILAMPDATVTVNGVATGGDIASIRRESTP